VEPPEVQYAKSGDVSIAYSIVGNGPFDLVFVSGWVFSALEYAWEGPPEAFFRRLASFSRLIVFDKRGTGLSDRTTGMPDLETRMDDIRAVMEAVGSKRTAIIGVSEGGPMTLLFAATYPERTAAVILYGCGVSYVRTEEYPWANSQEDWDEFIREMSANGETREWLQEALELEAPSVAHDNAVKRWWRTWVLTSASPGAVVALWRMNMGIDARHSLPAIRVPSLVLHREGDKVYDVAEARYMAERIPNVKLVELPGEDHAWWIEPETIAQEAHRFLDGIWDSGEWNVVESDRVLATVLFTDIVDSTAKLAELGDHRWKELLQQHHALVRREPRCRIGNPVSSAGRRRAQGRPRRVAALRRRASRHHRLSPLAGLAQAQKPSCTARACS
jgi:pimeloyl-ACP methyl ester carboxylesterase